MTRFFCFVVVAVRIQAPDFLLHTILRRLFRPFSSMLDGYLSTCIDGFLCKYGAGRPSVSKFLYRGSGRWFIMIFLQLTGFFRLFRGCVCPALSVPGFRSDVQRTPRLNTLEGNPVQLGRGGTLFDGLLSILFWIKACGSRIL